MLRIRLRNLYTFQARAAQAFAEQDFQTAVECLSQLVAREPNNIVWLEGRAQALVDGKQFARALGDYNKCGVLRRAPLPVLTSCMPGLCQATWRTTFALGRYRGCERHR